MVSWIIKINCEDLPDKVSAWKLWPWLTYTSCMEGMSCLLKKKNSTEKELGKIVIIIMEIN